MPTFLKECENNMGRVFTINFNFEQKAANALVCMYKKGCHIRFKIHVFNEDLQRILPQGNLEFGFAEGLETTTSLQHQKGKQLASCIADEISQFLGLEQKNHWQQNAP